MNFHWQNLNEQPGDRVGPPTQGRCWWHFLGGVLGLEWYLGRMGLAVGLESDDEAVKFHIAIPLLNLWVVLENFGWVRFFQPKEYRKTDYPGLAPGYWTVKHRDISFSVSDGGIRVRLWANPWEWSSTDPQWKHLNLDFADTLFGRSKYARRELSVIETVIPMPERSYPATIKLCEDSWSRPRGRTVYLLRADIDVPGGIPHPGKGENAWDCGEDATYSLCCPAKTAEEAVASMVETVLQSRRRYGGSINWIPATAKV